MPCSHYQHFIATVSAIQRFYQHSRFAQTQASTTAALVLIGEETARQSRAIFHAEKNLILLEVTLGANLYIYIQYRVNSTFQEMYAKEISALIFVWMDVLYSYLF